MADPRRMPQLNVDITEAVKDKLSDLEGELVQEGAKGREIVAVLIAAASAKKFPVAALRRYRNEFEAEKKRREAAPPG